MSVLNVGMFLFGINDAMNGMSILSQEHLLDFGIILAWILLGVVTFAMMYRKKGFDN